MSMSGENAPRPPFDEATALAELENLRQSIERARQQRKNADAEFDTFVRGFKKFDDVVAASAPPDPLLPFPSESPVKRQTAPPVQAPAIAPPPSLRVVEERVPVGVREPLPAQVVPPPQSEPPALSPERGRRPVRAGAIVAVSAVAIAGVIFGLRSWRTAPQQPPAATTAQAVPPPAQPRRPAPVAAAAPPQTAITAIRPVWVRVIVDGKRLLAREMQAGESMPLGDGATVVVRAGDAGALRLSIAGRDQPVGRDGEVVTRTFNLK